MKQIVSGFLCVIIVALSITGYADEPDSLKALSAWTNQSGSTLYIESISNDGQIVGSYINRAQGYGCQNIEYPVTGWVYGTAITFTVDWKSAIESCNSITSWTGFLYQGKIQTLWQLVVNGSSSTSQIINGPDTFKPGTMKIHKTLILDKQ